jgi:hypothetical protein
MAAYYTTQAYDAPPAVIWSILVDFGSWPRWFPNVSSVAVEGGADAARGAHLVAVGDDPAVWTRWQVVEIDAPLRLVCEHVDSNTPVSSQVQAAYLMFELIDEPEGCTLEVELGAEGYGMVGDFFVGVTMGPSVRRLLPQLIDAFTAHVIERVRARS